MKIWHFGGRKNNVISSKLKSTANGDRFIVFLFHSFFQIVKFIPQFLWQPFLEFVGGAFGNYDLL